MTQSLDSFKCRKILKVGSKSYVYFSLTAAEKNGLKGISKLPYSMRVLLENLLRYEDGQTVTKDDIKALMPNDVMPLYKAKYWDTIKGDDLPEGVDYAVFDFAINSGPSRAAKALQSVLGVNPDGKIGPATLDALEAANPRDIATSICEARLAFLQSLPTYGTFGKGWSRRVSEVENTAFKMVE